MTPTQKGTLLAAAAAIGAFLAPAASALTIVDNTKLLIGIVEPGTPAGLATETARIEYFVDQINLGIGAGTVISNVVAIDGALAFNPQGKPKNLVKYTFKNGSDLDDPLPDDIETTIASGGSQPAGSGATKQTVNLGTGDYDYLLVKFGQDSAYWYIGDLDGEIEVTSPFLDSRGRGNGSSHYHLFNAPNLTPPPPPPTPLSDNGFSLALLGAGLSGLSVMARRKKA